MKTINAKIAKSELLTAWTSMLALVIAVAFTFKETDSAGIVIFVMYAIFVGIETGKHAKKTSAGEW